MRKNRKILSAKYTAHFIINFFLITVLGFGLFGLATSIMLSIKIGPTYFEGISSISQLEERLPLIFSTTAFIQAISLSFTVLLLGLFWSHSVSGPLVRFRRYLKELAQGKFSQGPLFFREKDHLHGLALALSELMKRCKEGDEAALKILAEADRVLGEDIAFALKLGKLERLYSELKDIYPLK